MKSRCGITGRTMRGGCPPSASITLGQLLRVPAGFPAWRPQPKILSTCPLGTQHFTAAVLMPCVREWPRPGLISVLSSPPGFTPPPGAHAGSLAQDAPSLLLLEDPRLGPRDAAVHPPPDAAPPAAPPAAAAADTSGCGPGSPPPPPYLSGSTLMGLTRLP